MPTYCPAKDDLLGLLGDVMEKYHGHLVDARVTVSVLMAHPSGDDPHALRLHGYPCVAVVKVVPYLYRCLRLADSLILVDATKWERLTEPQRRALLDHELTHLELQHGKDGLKRDDQGRPKLACREHDWQLGGFSSVARRHGLDALEVLYFREAKEVYQAELFGDDVETAWGRVSPGDQAAEEQQPIGIDATIAAAREAARQVLDLAERSRAVREDVIVAKEDQPTPCPGCGEVALEPGYNLCASCQADDDADTEASGLERDDDAVFAGEDGSDLLELPEGVYPLSQAEMEAAWEATQADPVEEVRQEAAEKRRRKRGRKAPEPDTPATFIVHGKKAPIEAIVAPTLLDAILCAKGRILEWHQVRLDRDGMAERLRLPVVRYEQGCPADSPKRERAAAKVKPRGKAVAHG